MVFLDPHTEKYCVFGPTVSAYGAAHLAFVTQAVDLLVIIQETIHMHRVGPRKPLLLHIARALVDIWNPNLPASSHRQNIHRAYPPMGRRCSQTRGTTYLL